jgi:hypothetical protein
VEGRGGSASPRIWASYEEEVVVTTRRSNIAKESWLGWLANHFVAHCQCALPKRCGKSRCEQQLSQAKARRNRQSRPEHQGGLRRSQPELLCSYGFSPIPIFSYSGYLYKQQNVSPRLHFVSSDGGIHDSGWSPLVARLDRGGGEQRDNLCDWAENGANWIYPRKPVLSGALRLQPGELAIAKAGEFYL